jgi:hypothetical protein
MGGRNLPFFITIIIMVGSGMLDGLNGLFNFFIGCVIVAILGVAYFLFSMFIDIVDDKEIISTKPIIPELRLTITENKVDTLYIYRLKK